MRYRTSPVETSSNDDKDEHSSFPMEFLPLHDTEQSVSSHLSCYRQESGWILDEQERQVLWVPLDLLDTSDAYGKKVVLGSKTGRVAILDFSDAKYCPRWALWFVEISSVSRSYIICSKGLYNPYLVNHYRVLLYINDVQRLQEAVCQWK
jgi:hypothetical protein